MKTTYFLVVSIALVSSIYLKTSAEENAEKIVFFKCSTVAKQFLSNEVLFSKDSDIELPINKKQGVRFETRTFQSKGKEYFIETWFTENRNLEKSQQKEFQVEVQLSRRFGSDTVEILGISSFKTLVIPLEKAQFSSFLSYNGMSVELNCKNILPNDKK